MKFSLHTSTKAQAKHPAAQTILDDGLYAILLLVAGILIGTWFSESGIVSRFHFYQDKFAPAVMAACGHGFTQPMPEPPALTSFLALKQTSFDCAHIPLAITSSTPDLFQLAHRYLLLTAAELWKLNGISWNSLNILYGWILGLTGLASYALCRTAMGRPLSFLCASLMIVSPVQLFNLPHLRDYIKAPFFLAVLALLAWQLRASQFDKRSWGWAALAGALIGIGIGYRIDVITLAPLYLFCLFAFLPGKWHADLPLKLACAMIFLASLVACAFPIFSGFKSGGNTFHVLILGLMGEFDAKLGLAPGFYSLGHHYLDMYVSTVLNAYAGLAGSADSFIAYPSVQYDQLGAQYYLEVLRTFPADIAARFLGAAWQILHLPVTAFVTFEDLYFFYDDLVNRELSVFLHQPIWDFVVAAVLAGALLCILRCNLRQCLATLFILLFVTGYPFLQFSVRHYFYLQIVGLWLAGLLIQALASKVAGRQFGAPYHPTVPFADSRAMLLRFTVFTIIIPGALLVGLRFYQSGKMWTLLERYATAKTLPLKFERLSSNGTTTFALTGLFPDTKVEARGGAPVHTEFLVVEFDGRQCSRSAIHVKYVYEFESSVYDFSRRSSMEVDGKTRVVFPAFYRAGHLRFGGIEMPSSEGACLVDIRRVAEPGKLGSVPLTVEFSSQWLNRPRYRQFATH